MAPQSSILVKKELKQAAKNYQDDILEPVVNPLKGFPAGFCSSSQDQVNSGVVAKDHSRVHLCLGLAISNP
ncbi:unnamed protein product [Nezara viridula]|uniref:Uncharacterized protein n=1 Tax=Nezara viridula TaxID=85310 RepID=A0A9P0H0F0_NEZVI|nr:unnamed protein product [Nezara viridula]